MSADRTAQPLAARPPGAPALRVIPPRAPMRAPVPPRARRAPCGRTVAALLAAADAAALLAVCAALARALPHAPPGPLPTLLPLAAVVLVLNAAAGLYRPGPAAAALDELPRLLGHAVIGWCLAAALTPASPHWTSLAAAMAAQAATACAARAAVYRARRRAARRRPRATLVVGTGPAGERVAAALAGHLEYGMRPVGLVGPVPARLPEIAPLPVLTTTRDIGRAVAHHAVRDAVFACPPRERLVRLFWERGCRVWFVDAERHPSAARLTAPAPAPATTATGHLWGFACHRLDPPDARRTAWWGRAGKRALDVAVAATALLLAAPLLAGCALAVRLADGPGVIFRQERVGKDGRPFTIMKFRTLRPADDREAATRWTIAHDRRVSRVGRLLRRASLDELPQLWNVLRGDMSLVGPRPERPHFVERFSKAYPGYAERHRVPVGLTGLAQISGLRGDTSIEDRTRFDNHYIDTWSLWQDVRIMLRTTAACFRLGGS